MHNSKMAKEIESELDSSNQFKPVEEIDFSNADAAKEAYQKMFESHQTSSENNKRLYARAKKAEGFELVDGKWTKPESKKETKEFEPEPSKEPSKPNDDLDYGEKAYLRSALNLKGADELQLAREWKKKYGSTAEEMETDEVFLSRLTNLREAKETAAAIPKGQKHSSQASVTDLDLAVSKFKETGELPSDFKTRNAVIDKVSAEEKGPSFKF